MILVVCLGWFNIFCEDRDDFFREGGEDDRHGREEESLDDCKDSKVLLWKRRAFYDTRAQWKALPAVQGIFEDSPWDIGTVSQFSGIVAQ